MSTGKRFETTAQALDAEAPRDFPLWGFPRFSEVLGQWVLDWLDYEAQCHGVTFPTPEGLAWIRSNPDEIATMRDELVAWIAGAGWYDSDDIPF